jgi:uncharacterized protein with GYD domain
MQTYLALAKHTVEAKQEIKEMPEWHENMSDVISQVDGEVLETYHGSIEDYDAVIVFELPDGKSSEQARLLLERDGTHEFEISEVFGHDEYREFVEALP